MIQSFKKSIFISSILLLVTSCSQELENGQKNGKQFEENGYFISENEAVSMASLISYSSKGSLDGKTNSSTRTVSRTMAIPDSTGVPAFYIMNYKEGGFIVISGDKRSIPILAFSKENGFDLDSKILPSGLIGWLNETTTKISNLRYMSTEAKLDIAAQMEGMYGPCPTQQIVDPYASGALKCEEPDTPNDCEESYQYSKGPLIGSKWGQELGYNNLLPYMGCNNENGRPPSGCVATAIGQVMRYHESPVSYNWNAMPLTSGSNEVSRLLRDIGTAVNMDYACDGSGAQTESGMTALKNTFGYSSASFGEVNYTTIENEIKHGRPVVMAGHKIKDCFLWWCSYKQGHAWVCEGYSIYGTCYSVSTHFHMNWGWGGEYNGSYANNGDTNYKYNKRMLYNIKP